MEVWKVSLSGAIISLFAANFYSANDIFKFRRLAKFNQFGCSEDGVVSRALFSSLNIIVFSSTTQPKNFA